MDPNQTLRLAAEAGTEEDWLKHWRDYSDWRTLGGYAASAASYDAAISAYNKLLRKEQ